MRKARVFPVTETERLILDDLHPEDEPAIYALFSHPKVMEYFDMEPLTRPKQGVDMIELLRHKFVSGNGLRWALREKRSGTLVGTCGFNSWVAFDHSAIIGYELHPEFWGQGYATEAVAHVIKMGYCDELPISLNRIEALVVPGNRGSENVLKKNGFKLEGCLREKGFWSNRYHDMHLYSLIRSDYQVLARE